MPILIRMTVFFGGSGVTICLTVVSLKAFKAIVRSLFFFPISFKLYSDCFFNASRLVFVSIHDRGEWFKLVRKGSNSFVRFHPSSELSAIKISYFCTSHWCMIFSRELFTLSLFSSFSSSDWKLMRDYIFVIGFLYLSPNNNCSQMQHGQIYILYLNPYQDKLK